MTSPKGPALSSLRASGRALRRRRELAGDERAGRFARAQARKKQRAFARRNYRVLLALVIGPVLPVLAAMPFTSSAFLRGFAIGAALTGAIGAAAIFVLQYTGTAPQMMGDLGEQWTASELRPLQRRGWKLINHFIARGGNWPDIDHVLLGPGGIFAIETKWSAASWNLTSPDGRVREAVARAKSSARHLELVHYVRSCGKPTVTPLVVLWGGTGDPTIQHTVDGVTVLSGRQIKPWRTGLRGGALTPEQVDNLWTALDEETRTRDAVPNPHEDVPPSVGQLLFRLTGLVAVGIAAFMTSANIYPWTRSVPIWLGANAVLLSAGVLARRHRQGRHVGLALITGTAAALLAALLIVLYTLWP